MQHRMEPRSAGADYTATKGTLTFNPGDTSQTFNIPILADTIDENNEVFSVTLSSPTNAVINDFLDNLQLLMTIQNQQFHLQMLQQQMKMLAQQILLQHSLQPLKKQSPLTMLHQMEQQLLVQIILLELEQSHLPQG